MDARAEEAAAVVADAEFEARERATRRRRRRTQLGAVLAVVLIAVGGLAWATDGFSRSAGGLLHSILPQCPPTVALNGSGSTLIQPLMTSWVTAYSGAASSRMQGCVVVLPTYAASDASAALGQLTVGGTEFVATEEPLSPSAEVGFATPTVTLPLAAGGIAVAYNVPGVGAGLNFTATILAGIYLGAITLWNDSAIAAVNPGVSLPAGLPITVVHDGPGSSTSFVFTGFLGANNATWASEVGQGPSVSWPTGVGVDGDAAVATRVVGTPGAIGYLGLGPALAADLTCAKVENPSGAFVAPSATTIFVAVTADPQTLPLGNQSWQNVSLLDEPGADAYPITTFTYGIVYADLGLGFNGTMTLNVAQWLAAFLYWMSVAGQSYGATLGYAPFPQKVTMANQQIVELLRYDGVPALGDVDFDGD